MRTCLLQLVMAIVGFACRESQVQAATVNVQFLPPQQYTDVGCNEVPAIDPLGEIRRHLVRLGQQLPSTETMTVEVLDIDLAGISRPVVGKPGDLRLLRGSGTRRASSCAIR